MLGPNEMGVTKRRTELERELRCVQGSAAGVHCRVAP